MTGWINVLAQCNCTFTIPAGAGIYTFDGAQKGVRPGDVICLAAGFREKIIFNNVAGTADKAVQIVNCGGQVRVGGATINHAISFARSRYVRISGAGDTASPYGIKILGSKPGSQGVLVSDLTSDIEIDHLEITATGFAGIMAKSDPSKDCSVTIYERPNFTMHNVVIHDNYVHDIGGEGIYCGNSFYGGTTAFCPIRTQFPHEIRGVRIYNNIFDNCAWESIQVGSAVSDVEIHHNRVLNYGAANVTTQNGGIQVGVGSTGRVYDNFIKNGTGVAILIQGLGGIYVYNNVIINSGTYAMILSLKPTPLPTDIVPQTFVGPVHIMNNTIITPTDKTIKESVPGATGNILHNNFVVGGPNLWNDLRKDTDWKQKNNLYFSTLAQANVVNPALDDYRLNTGSAAINGGTDVTTFGVADDFDNRARPFGASMDVSAFEFGANQKPIVNAGANQTLTLPTVTSSLAGSASDPDGSIVSHLWTKHSGPTAVITNATSTSASVAGLIPGVYVFRLTATDNQGATGFDDLIMTLVDPSVNQPPVANSGGDKDIISPVSSTQLTGSAFDPDGAVVSYQWTKITSLSVTMGNATIPTLSLTGLVEGVHTFRLRVTDDDGDIDTKDATIRVLPGGLNQPPVANAGPDINLTLPTNSVTITGLATDAEGPITSYNWFKVSGGPSTLINAITPTVQITNLSAGTYVFRFNVTDDQAVKSIDEVTVNVSSAGQNQAPTANAGPGTTSISLPTNSTTLSGSGSDADGTITSYVWSKVSGPTATLTNATTPTLSLSNLVQGTYVFRLTVSDNLLATAGDDITLIVHGTNLPPVVDAGPVKTLTIPMNSTTLTGSANDVNGPIVSYLWEKVSGPAATLGVVNVPSLVLTNLAEGAYVFRLTATDTDATTASDDVSVIVFPANTNQAPIVDGGNNVTLTLPTNSTVLTSSASDPDGTIASRLWEKVNGPGATLGSTTGATLTLSNLLEGIYVFRITVTDNLGSSASDDVTVTVGTTNQPPVVSALPNRIVVFPASSINLPAVASDPDGTIATYGWFKVTGPPGTSLSGTATNTLSVTGLTLGIHIFRVIVTDNQGATASSDVNVSVQTSANGNPVVDAGPGATLFLPTNSVNLTGFATDSDGTIASYAWTKVFGPGGTTLANANTPTLTASNLVPGTYLFRLTATDNQGNAGIDDVTVIVKVATANQSPVADAGPDIALTLPVNSTNLIGSGSDPEGSVIQYQWIKVSGPSVTTLNPGNPVLSVHDLVEGIYIFRLTVTDNVGVSASSDTQLTVLPAGVNQSPVVSTDNTIVTTLPRNSLTLLATASDTDGAIVSYAWSKQVGPTASLDGANTANLSLSNLAEGNYIFRVTVNDDDGASSFAEVNLSVLPLGTNQPPLLDAGADRILFLPDNSVNLEGSASDSDGSVASYSWVKIGGPLVTISNANSPAVSLANLTAGQYVFRLTATDDDGGTAFDQVIVTVFPPTVNQSPVANAGTNKTLIAPASAGLNGSGFDPDGSIVSYSWSQASGPECSIENIGSPTLIVNDMLAGVYQFQLMVSDNNGATGADVTTITVVDIGFDQPPVADAGFDKVVNLPIGSVTIQGSGVDPDGMISTFSWIKKSGPAAGTLHGEDTNKLTLMDPVAGTYQFTLTVTDGGGLQNSDDVKVTVMPQSINDNPVVNAGADGFLRLPLNSQTLTAVAQDDDGAIVSYFWKQLSGPVVTPATSGASTFSLNNLVLGTYTFSVEVTDDQGSTASDEVSVTVAPPGVNRLPFVLAGASKVVTPPETSTVLSGSAWDLDGSIVSLSWTQEAGPTQATLSGEHTTTLAAEGLAPGTYTFRLTALDNEGAISYSETSVVFKLERQPPLVFAGNDTTLVIPDNFMALSGIAIPGDDPISQYRWIQTSGQSVDIKGEYPDVVLSPLLPGVYAFQFTVVDSKGVEATDDIIITVLETPNSLGASLVFSPNGDAVNDVWTIRNLDKIKGCPLSIFNSLGKSIFQTEEYHNDWDGVSNGQTVRDGDYYFVVECDSKKTYSGAFRLIR